MFVRVALLLTFFHFCLAWFPLSHEHFGCVSHGGVPDCISSIPGKSYVLGCSSPDAMKLLNGALHSWKFAAFQAEFASSYWSSSDKFSPVDYSMGYGAHLAGDLIGHHHNGFLMKNDHELSLAVDGYVLKNLWNNTSMSSQLFPIDGVEFVYESVKAYSEKYGDVPEYTLEQVNDTVLKFEVGEGGEQLLLETYTEGFIQKRMITDSFCQVSDFEDVKGYFQEAVDWVVDCIVEWEDSMKKKPDPTTVEGILVSFAEDIFTKHGDTSCNSTSIV